TSNDCRSDATNTSIPVPRTHTSGTPTAQLLTVRPRRRIAPTAKTDPAAAAPPMTSPAGVPLAFCHTTDSSDASGPYRPLPVQLRELEPARAMRSANGAIITANIPSAQPRRTGRASSGAHHNQAIKTVAV